MSRARELEALAARVEQLTGPDREVDELIGAGVNPQPDARVVYYSSAHRLYLKPGSGRIPFHVSGGKGTKFHIIHQSSRYTASLDAAMTLVPEGCAFRLYNWPRQEGRDKACVLIEGGRETWAATPALALTAAALRALASEAQP